ncbi:MAG: DUF3575 domain-containing protein [Chitinophagales bacterium]
MIKFAFLVFSLLFCCPFLHAQTSDSIKKKSAYPNIIKLNLSSMIEFKPSVVVSYERLVKPQQSFQVMAGYITFPQLFGNSPEDILFAENKSRSGFRVGADYRFYFKNENKYEAPRGLYWGPFVDYFHFNNSRTLTVNDTSFATGTLDFISSLQIGAAGVNLGYQFVIKKRLSVDLCLFGPALAFYGASLRLEGDYDLNQEHEYLQKLYDYLINNFPLLGDLSNGDTIQSNGQANFLFAGFRYSVSAGFRF